MKSANILLLIVLLGVSIWMLSSRRTLGSQPRFEILQAGLSQNEDQNDSAVLSQLRLAGSDLSKATDVVFYLYIPSLTDARAAAATLRENGYSPEVKEPLGRLPNGHYESRYSVVAHIEVVPTMENIKRARQLYTELAHRYNGEYDGWEAAVAH